MKTSTSPPKKKLKTFSASAKLWKLIQEELTSKVEQQVSLFDALQSVWLDMGNKNADWVWAIVKRIKKSKGEIPKRQEEPVNDDDPFWKLARDKLKFLDEADELVEFLERVSEQGARFQWRLLICSELEKLGIVVPPSPISADEAATKVPRKTFDLNRWFQTDENYYGGRYNEHGFFTPGTMDVNWNDFEKTLNQEPDLAFEENDENASVIIHCLASQEPSAPVSVIKKLVSINPKSTETRWLMDAPLELGDGPALVGFNVLQIYLNLNHRWMKSAEISFDVCQALIEARPVLLLEKDDHGESGYSYLEDAFPKQAKILHESLKERGLLDESDAAVANANRAVKRMRKYGKIVQ